MASAEEKFYKNYNNYDLKALEKNSKKIPNGFHKGGRYNICSKSMDNNSQMSRRLIVELGCANGESLQYLKNKYGFHSAIGCDLAFNDVLEIDNTKLLSTNLNEKWFFADSSVDCLVAMMIFEHLFDPWFCFSEVKRVLAPNGRAFVNLPLVTSIKNRLRLLNGQLPVTSVPYSRWRQEGHWDGFHLHYFSIRSILDLAESSGLKVVRKNAVGKFNRLKDIFPSLLCSEISFELSHLNDL